MWNEPEALSTQGRRFLFVHRAKDCTSEASLPVPGRPRPHGVPPGNGRPEDSPLRRQPPACAQEPLRPPATPGCVRAALGRSGLLWAPGRRQHVSLRTRRPAPTVAVLAFPCARLGRRTCGTCLLRPSPACRARPAAASSSERPGDVDVRQNHARGPLPVRLPRLSSAMFISPIKKISLKS